jgi:hypothetical protein
MRTPRIGAAFSRALLAWTAVAALALPPSGARSADAPVASDPVFTALTVDGARVSGRIRQFGAKGELTLVTVEGPERVIPLDTLVKLTRDGVNTHLTPEAAVVLFPDGDRLYRTAIGSANETTLEVQSYTLGHLALPLDSLLGLIFRVPDKPDALGLSTDLDVLEAVVHRVRGEPRASEVLWLNNGDKLSGGFVGLTDKTVSIQPAKDPVVLDRADVVALGFEPKLVSYPKPEDGFLELTFSDGSRLGVSEARVEQGHVLARTRFGVPIRVPIADVARVHARTPSVVYLTERVPAAERSVPYVGPPRPYRRDATVEGHPLRLSGQDFDRGIGTQSRSLLAYLLEPGDKRFQAEVGLDDRAGPLGNVVFRVLVDNRERFASPPMSARDTPRSIDLDVSGGKNLILITEFGERGGVRDLGDWAEARIIR